MTRISALSFLLVSALLTSCTHQQYHRITTGSDRATVVQKEDSLELSLTWNFDPNGKEASHFRFPKSPAVATFSDGSKFEAMPTFVLRQFKQHPESKFPLKEGFHSRSTSKGWIYDIYKDKTVFGVPRSDFVTTYDATPKDRVAPLGENFDLSAPDAGYESQVLLMVLKLPKKNMDFDISIPTEIVDSRPLEALRFNAKFVDEWKAVRLAP